MSPKLFKSLLLLAIAIVGFVGAAYDVRIETLSKIEGDTETLLEFNLRLVGRQHLLNGTIISHVDFDDTFEFACHLESFVNGEWKTSAIVGKFKVCTFMTSIYARYWEPSFKDTNMPKGKEGCPFKKGEYYLTNVELQADNWAAYASRGHTRLEFKIRKNNITYGGFVASGLLNDRNT